MKIKKMKVLLCTLLLMISFQGGFAQRVMNFGLSEKQDPNTLPRSRVALQTAKPKTKEKINTAVLNIGDGAYLLEKGWELIEENKFFEEQQSIFDSNLDTRNWHNATVPGTVLTTLVNEGVYPDPYWGINNMAIPDSLCRTNWWYRIAFDAPDTSAKNCNLVFEGINYRADIWFNGNKLGRINGAFTRGVFDVSKLLHKNKKNVLAVKIIPPSNPGIAQEASMTAGHGLNGGVMCLDGPTFISSEGWDWIPTMRDRNIGIWQDVKLDYFDDIRIIDPQIITDLNLPDTTSVDLSLRLKLANNSTVAKQVTVKLNVDNVNISYPVSLKANEEKEVFITPNESPELKMKNPRLWWPNGYGKQNLYTMNIAVEDAGIQSDVCSVRFGIREMEYEFAVDAPEEQNVRICLNPIDAYKNRTPIFDNNKRREIALKMKLTQLVGGLNQPGVTKAPDAKMGPYLVVKVNGQRIYCRGGNWGMDDGMKRVSRERLEPYFKLHQEQNFTMIRNWTGESTEKVFYDLCDEYGILVFNDFWLSTEGYNLNVSDNDLFMSNVVETIKRYRNHPSIAIWNPRNEGFAPAELEEKLNKAVIAEDGTRHYQPCSIEMNISDSGPWDYKNPVEFFSKFADGFNTEVGSPSVPTAETILRMMSPEDSWPIGDVWAYHDWHMGKWGDHPFMQSYEKAINSMFGKSDNLNDFCKKAQLVNYESYRAIFEGWNSKLWNNASGVMLWMSHPAWPSMVWQTYSHDMETPGAYFGAKKACTPLHIQMDLDTYTVKIINTTLKSYKGLNVIVNVYDINGRLLHNQKLKTDAPANQMQEVLVINKLSEIDDNTFVKLTLENKKQLLGDNFYWMDKNKDSRDYTAFNTLKEAKLSIKSPKINKVDGVMKGEFVVSNTGDSPAIGIKFNLKDKAKNEIILPTYFSDGYFFLMPGESKIIKFSVSDKTFDATPQLRIEGYNLKQTTFDM